MTSSVPRPQLSSSTTRTMRGPGTDEDIAFPRSFVPRRFPPFPGCRPSPHPPPRMRTSALFLAGALVVTACTGREALRAAEAPGGTIIIASMGEATDVFPPYVNEMNGRIIQDLVFDRLAEIDRSLTTVGDKSFAPRLARRWTWAPDSLSIAFELDPRARWHDGKPVTAADVRYSFRAFTDPKAGSPVAPLLSNVDSVSVRDSSTAVVWFKKHTPEQFYDVAYQLVIIPE